MTLYYIPVFFYHLYKKWENLVIMNVLIVCPVIHSDWEMNFTFIMTIKVWLAIFNVVNNPVDTMSQAPYPPGGYAYGPGQGYQSGK